MALNLTPMHTASQRRGGRGMPSPKAKPGAWQPVASIPISVVEVRICPSCHRVATSPALLVPTACHCVPGRAGVGVCPYTDAFMQHGCHFSLVCSIRLRKGHVPTLRIGLFRRRLDVQPIGWATQPSRTIQAQNPPTLVPIVCWQQWQYGIVQIGRQSCRILWRPSHIDS